MGFSCKYHINNPNLSAQKGLFILNPDSEEPLIERMLNKTNLKIFNCVDIHKSLIPHIQETYLKPEFISFDTIYPPTKDSKELQKILTKSIQIPLGYRLWDWLRQHLTLSKRQYMLQNI